MRSHKAWCEAWAMSGDEKEQRRLYLVNARTGKVGYAYLGSMCVAMVATNMMPDLYRRLRRQIEDMVV